VEDGEKKIGPRSSVCGGQCVRNKKKGKKASHSASMAKWKKAGETNKQKKEIATGKTVSLGKT